MAVYTDITEDELIRFLAAYEVGSLTSYKGIAEGVENSNFLLHTTKGAYILTLYEKRVNADDLPFSWASCITSPSVGFPARCPFHAPTASFSERSQEDLRP